MKRTILTLALLLSSGAANAACYADYKAKRDNPLRLHYGVIELPQAQCNENGAATALRARLNDGWELLQVMTVFGDEGLDERKDSAGAYFLRY